MTVVRRRFGTPQQLGTAAAAAIAAGIAESRRSGRRYVLGCPGGRTPKPIYEALGRLCAEDGIDCSGVVLAMMDEYLDPHSDGAAYVSISAHNSCRRFAEHEIRQVINQRLPATGVVAPESVWFPDPLDPAAYDDQIAEAGGVDVFIAASGASDGHVAFCGPGAALDGGTAIVELAPTTRADNIVTFPDFASVDERRLEVAVETTERALEESGITLDAAERSRVFVGIYQLIGDKGADANAARVEGVLKTVTASSKRARPGRPTQRGRSLRRDEE